LKTNYDILYRKNNFELEEWAKPALSFCVAQLVSSCVFHYPELFQGAKSSEELSKRRGESMGNWQELTGLFEEEVKDLGYGLYHVEYVREEGMNILRFYIDHENGIKLEDCEKVSRRVSDILDEKDPISEDYNLEVSSPGIFRTLFTRAHMMGAVGEKVQVKTKKPVDGAKKFVGILQAVEEEAVTVLKDQKELVVSFENIRSMNIEVDL